jgi:hypothetical protein
MELRLKGMIDQTFTRLNTNNTDFQKDTNSRLIKAEEYSNLIHQEVTNLQTKSERTLNEPKVMFGKALEDVEQKLVQIYNLVMLDHGRVDIVNVINEGLRNSYIII